MTSDPPSSPENENPGIPPRHRITLENLQNESIEENLWALDDDEETPVDPAASSQPTAYEDLERQGRRTNIPEIKARKKPTPDSNSPQPPPAEPQSTQRHEPVPPKTYFTPNQSTAHDDFGDLDNWDDSEPPLPATPNTVQATEESPQPGHPPSPAPGAGIAPVLEIPESPKTSNNRKKNNANLTERIALISLAAILLLGASFFLLNAFKGLPRLEDPYEMPKLPAQGAHVAITQIESFWRIPVTSGPNADTVQRGIELMPVLQITATAPSAALRVQFRNSEGAPVGDPVTHSLQGESELTIPSTAGFEDIKIHSAYRTGLIEPWTAEILEAPAGTTAGSAFRTLITIPISPIRR